MKGKSMQRENLPLNEKRLYELHGLLLSGKLSLLDFVNACFSGRKIKKVWFQNRHVWVFEFSSGDPVFINTVLTNRGCKGLMMCSASGMKPNSQAHPATPGNRAPNNPKENQ